jgi:hypothetical protein
MVKKDENNPFSAYMAPKADYSLNMEILAFPSKI